MNAFNIGQHLVHTSNINLLFVITDIDSDNKKYKGIMKKSTGFDHEEMAVAITFDGVHQFYDVSSHVYNVGETFNTTLLGERAVGVVKELLPHGLYLIHRTTYLGDSPKDMGCVLMDEANVQAVYEVPIKTEEQSTQCPQNNDSECEPIDVGFHFTKYVCKTCNKEMNG